MFALVFLMGALRSELSTVSTAPLRSGHTTCSLPLSDAVTPPLQRRPGKIRRGAVAALAARHPRQLSGLDRAAALALCKRCLMPLVLIAEASAIAVRHGRPSMWCA